MCKVWIDYDLVFQGSFEKASEIYNMLLDSSWGDSLTWG